MVHWNETTPPRTFLFICRRDLELNYRGCRMGSFVMKSLKGTGQNLSSLVDSINKTHMHISKGIVGRL